MKLAVRHGGPSPLENMHTHQTNTSAHSCEEFCTMTARIYVASPSPAQTKTAVSTLCSLSLTSDRALNWDHPLRCHEGHQEICMQINGSWYLQRNSSPRLDLHLLVGFITFSHWTRNSWKQQDHKPSRGFLLKTVGL